MGVLLLVATIQLFFAYQGVVWSETWFALLLVALGTGTLLAGKEERAVPVLCLLLASLSALFSFIDAEEVGELAGPAFGSIWNAVRFLFPFVFVHLALIFPLPSGWISRHSRRLATLYAPYAVLLPLIHWESSSDLAGLLLLLFLPVGFVLGVAILVRQYLFSLTSAEKNRLRVVLIGCLAGGLPFTVSVMGKDLLPYSLHQLSYSLLPLLPLSLVFAVLKENFSEIGRGWHRLLVWSLAASAMLTVFFLSYLAGSFLRGEQFQEETTGILIASAFSLLLFYPFTRWVGSYVSAHFYTAETGPARRGMSLAAFEPIQPNPYIVGNPVRSPEMFFGREGEFQFIRTRLTGQRQGCVIVLCGERRTGKTSILYQLLNGRLGDRFVTVFLDMQGVVIERDQEFLAILASSIWKAVTPPDLAATAPSVTSYLDFNRFMEDAATRAGERHLLLLIDEYELIDAKVRDRRLSSEIYSYLNSLLERSPNLSFVFTGSNTLTPDSAWSALIGKSTYRQISFLARRDAQELICAPLRGRVEFTPGVVNSMLRLTHGHPFFTQLVCQMLVEVLNEKCTNIADDRILEESVRRVLENPPPQLFYEWTTLAAAEKLVLSALATLIKRPERFLPPERVERLVRSLPGELPWSLDRTQIHILFEKLRGRSVLDRDQDRYRFTMDLSRLWIQNEHTVWNVLSELKTADP